MFVVPSAELVVSRCGNFIWTGTVVLSLVGTYQKSIEKFQRFRRAMIDAGDTYVQEYRLTVRLRGLNELLRLLLLQLLQEAVRGRVQRARRGRCCDQRVAVGR